MLSIQSPRQPGFFKGPKGPEPLRTNQTLDCQTCPVQAPSTSHVTRVKLHRAHSEGLKSRHSTIKYMITSRSYHPFPPNTCGFFYFVPAPHQSVQLTSGVRFRVTRDNDPSSFAEGSDLLFLDHSPWRIPLANLARDSN